MDTEPTTTAVFAGLGRDEYERIQRELTGYCYRMLGSLFDADDAVQETMIRAWKGIERFEGRSAVRTWLHRIATNVCIDMLRGRSRRAVPMDLGPAISARTGDAGQQLPEHEWVLPAPDARILAATADPAQVAADRETVRLAFIAALQRLPARQRAVLILREVLSFSAAETAELLETTVASANSALQRARAAMAAIPGQDARYREGDSDGDPVLLGIRTAGPDDPDQKELLEEYVAAFESYDMKRLTALLREDAMQSMPPWPIWIHGADEIVAWMLGAGADCRGSRLVPFQANGSPAFAQYRSDGRGGHKPWSLQVLEIDGGRISEIHSYVFPELFEAYGFPAAL
ncbi:MAG TPA: sigma-70 family RNA polymerase sigma factor [Actinocrinis sp.]